MSPSVRVLSAASCCLSILAAVAAPAAADPVPVALDAPASGNIATPGATAVFSFEAPPGQRVFINRTATSNAAGLNWFLDDAYGRRLVSDLANLNDLGPLSLMGGAYLLTVQGENPALSTGTFSFTIVTVEDDAFSGTAGATLAGSIDEPGERDTFTLAVPSPGTYLLDQLSSTNVLGLNWALTDSHGNTFVAKAGSLADSGTLNLPAGTYTLDVVGEVDAVGTYSFRLVKGATTSSAISIGQVVSGAISVPTEQDDYTFSVSSTQEIYFDFQSSSNSLQLNWQLQTDDGLAIVPFGGSMADSGPFALLPGQYSLRVRSEGDTTPTYQFALVTPTHATIPINIDQVVSAGITIPGSTVDMVFTALPGQVVSIHTQSSTSSFALNYVLRDALGRAVLGQTTSVGFHGPFALLGGEYTLTLLPEAGATGSVTLRVVPVTTTMAAAAIGDAIAGALANPGDTNAYSFSAPPGQQVQLDLSASSNTLGLNWIITDAYGRNVLPQTASLADTAVIPLVGGLYTISIVGEGSATGSYQFQIVDAGFTSFVPAGQPLALGQLQAGVITPGQTDSYVIELQAPEVVFLDILSGDKDLDWSLTDPAGKTLFSGLRAQLDHGDDQGPFFLAAGSYAVSFVDPTNDAPAYSFQAVVPDVLSGVMALGDTVSGAAALPGFQHTYALELADDTEVYFEIASAGESLFWKLLDSAGQTAFARTAAKTKMNGSQGPLLLAAGSYTLVLDANSGFAPAYSFRAMPVEHFTTAVAVGDVIQGSFGGPGETREFTFTIAGTTAQPTYFDVLSVPADPGTVNPLQWALIDAAEQALFGLVTVNSTLDDQGPLLLEPGTYTLRLDPSVAAYPTYHFRITAPAVIDAALGTDQAAFATIATPGDRHVYHLSIDGSPQKLYFDNQLSAANTNATLEHVQSGWRPFSGVTIGNTSGSDRGPFVLVPGDYELTVAATGGATPSYQLGLFTVSDVDGGQIGLNEVVTGKVPSSGSTLAFTVAPESPGQPLTFDLMSSPSGLTWSLFDPVGTALFLNVNASNFATNDRGPFPLALGDYMLVFDAADDDTPKFDFRVKAPKVVEAIPPSCAACKSLDAVFVFDTSASMVPEATQVCSLADELKAGLADQGVPVSSTYWGITDTANIPCISSTVLKELGATVPMSPPPNLGALNQCPGGGQTSESWAAAAAIVAGSYGWTEGAARLVVTLSDEGPWCGDPVNADDEIAIQHAIAVAAGSDVVVSTIVSAGVVDPVLALAQLLADGTSGTSIEAIFQEGEAETAIIELANAACAQVDEAAQPKLFDVSPLPGSILPAGVPIVVSGRAEPVNALRPVVGVLVNGTLAPVYDAGGHFFATIVLAPGQNEVVLSPVEECGTFDKVVTYEGISQSTDPFAMFTEITAAVDGVFSGTSFGRGQERLLFDVTASTQLGSLDGPILMVLGPELHPSIKLVNADGLTPEGLSYVTVVPDGETLETGEITEPLPLALDDPERRHADFSVKWLAPANAPPYFTSVPIVSAFVGAPWSYLASADDPNGHPVTISLLIAPAGMTLAGTNPAAISFTPPAAGTYQVVARASDGRGGIATQTFTLAASVPGANQPPIFQSSPATHVSTGAAYAYDADASDPDGDSLTFAIAVGPPWLAIDALTGLVTAGQAESGNHSVQLSVSDGKGGSADQAFVLSVGVPSTNASAPVILSSPPVIVAAEALYLYAVKATDADGDALVYALTAAPAGMKIGASGLLEWIPSVAQLGTHPVTVQVTDGKGGVATQSYLLEVATDAPNQPPFFVSTPPLSGVVGQGYSYAPQAIDPEFEALAFALTAAPTGMQVAPDGTVTWTPKIAQAGAHPVVLTATDPEGAVATQAFSVVVKGANQPPSFNTTPGTTVLQGAQYYYLAKATDPDGDAITYSLLTAPPGATIYSTNGLVSWGTGVAAAGPHAFTLRASDGYGGIADQSFAVEVLVDTVPPVVSVFPIKKPVCIAELGTVCVSAYDSVGVASRTLEVAGVPLALDAAGCSSFIEGQPGLLTFTGGASDAAGNTSEATTDVQVVDCNDQEAPVVVLHQPFPGSAAFAPSDIVASISDNSPEVLTWEVRLGPAGGQSLDVIASGTGPISQAVVATVDTTLLRNDQYRIQIEASDGLQTGGVEFELGVAGDYKLGNFTVSFVDLVIPIAGIPLSIGRTYDTLDAKAGVSGDFGTGWRLTLSGEVSDSENEGIGQPGLVGLLSAEPYSLLTRVYVTRPDGRRVGFTFAPKPKKFPAAFQHTPHFEPDPGVTDTLEAPEDAEAVWSFGSTFFNYVIPYNPSVFVLKTADNVSYTLHEELGLTHVEDANGNTLDVTPEGIVSSTGVSLEFLRDAFGRIVTVVEPPESADPLADPPGELHYAYDAAGNLLSFTDQTELTVGYVYGDPAHPGYLTEIVDPLDRPLARNVYGDDGRIVALCTADGNIVTLEGCVKFGFDVAAGLSTTFDARGFRTDTYYDDDGDAVLVREFLVDGSIADTSHTFDAKHNETQRIDPDGNVWSWTYDGKRRKLSETDPSGATWTYAYGACQSPTAACDPLGNCTTRVFDTACNLASVKDALGHATSRQYDDRGLLLEVTDPAGEKWSFAYDTFGYLASITDPFGVTASYTFNSMGELTVRTDRKGQTVTWEYDAAHRVLTETWASSEPFVGWWSYTAAGQLEQMSDPYGTWSFTYWPTGLLRTVSNAGSPGAPMLELQYGQLEGGQLVTGWDGNGNVIRVSDSLGGTTEYVWNDRDRLVGLRQSGEGVDAKRVDIDTNGAGLPVALHRFADLGAAMPVASTTYEYTCGGCPSRLSGMTHERADGSLVDAIVFDRDLALGVTGATDAEGIHTFVHDGAHRLLAADHPAGGVQPDEAYAYDAAGNRQTSHLSATAIYASELDGTGHRLVEDDSAAYTYDLNGNLILRADKTTGEQRHFTYDFRNRLVSAEVVAAGGAVLHASSYEYALNDLRTRIEEDGVVRYVLHDGPNPVLAVTEDGEAAVRRLYLRSVDRIIAEETPEGTRWLLTDVLGTVRDSIDDAGQVLAHYVYDSFGRQLGGAPPSLDDSLRFVGREFGALHGLGYFRARWYDPALGRFTQEDSLEPWAYVYGASSPYLFSDAFGRTALLEYALELCDIIDFIGDTWGLGQAERVVFEAVVAGLHGEPVDPGAVIHQLLDAIAEFVSPDFPLPCVFGSFYGASQ